ncbi:NAD(P)-binding protein [Clavulina sp. PMI_390]|nr:NAD(P)-binding protein [Clavulina sp. PMI_390]
MPSYFITGASRGLGLAFAEKLLTSADNVVIASARNPAADSLKALAAKGLPGKLVTTKLDVTDFDAFPGVVAEAEKVLPDGLDYLIVNAGADMQTNAAFAANANDLKVFEQELKLNTVSPVATLRAFLPLLDKGQTKKALFLSTELASLTMAERIPFLSDSYSVSKAALNMVVRKYGAALKTLGSQVILLNVYPGWVPETELGQSLKGYFDKYAPNYPKTSLADSVEGTLKVLHTATADDHTKFLNYKYEPVPW